MSGKSAEQLLHEFRSSATADVTMSLLRSKDALLYLALMAAHLGDGQVVDGQSLAAAIDADLSVLLRSGVISEDQDEVSSDVPDADVLLRRWTKRGWLYCSPDPETQIERYQLTSGSSHAVLQMRNLQRKSSIATESALSMVMAEMRQIATEANPDPAARREAINEQIAALVARRDALDSGDAPQLNFSELADRVAALAQLIERIPSDVARYGEQMHANTAALLRQTFADDPSEFAESLQQMFDGHDVIAESPEGQAFRAFATVIATPSQRSQLETDIAEIVDRVEGLPAHLVETLNDFIDATWQRVREVENIRGVAFRRMSNFVRGGDVSHYRSMRTRISEAQASAAAAFRCTHGGRDIGFVVPLGGVGATSVGRLRLDEGLVTLPDPVTDSSDEFTIDAAALAGRESIDWVGLRSAVRAALEARGGFATLPEVLEHLPGPRTGDVIGLWWLATRHGNVDDAVSTTAWVHTGRGLRAIDVPYLVFSESLPEPAAPASDPRYLDVQAVLFEGNDDA